MTANLAKFNPDFLQLLKNSSKALRELKKVDPRERYAILYPDSDCAHVGMGFNCLENQAAEEVFDQSSQILGKDLWKLCLKGPKSDLLDSFETRSIATYVTSHARMVKFLNEKPHIYDYCKMAAGIGIGYINALVFRGAISFENGLDLVQKRAMAMEKAASIVPSARIKVCLAPAARKRKICQAAIEHCLKQNIPPEIAVCSVTKQTQSSIIEIGGHEEAIRYLEEENSDLFDFKWVKRLENDNTAYHTELMRPASEFLTAYMKHKMKNDPDYLKEPESCSVYSATSGERTRFLNSIKEDLCTSPMRPVKIEQLLHCLYARPQKLAQPNTLVVGDKKLLRNIMFVNRKAWSSAKLLRT